MDRLTQQLSSCPQDNKHQFGIIIDNIKIVWQGFRISIPESFKNQYSTIIQSMAQALNVNLNHEELSRKMLNFI